MDDDLGDVEIDFEPDNARGKGKEEMENLQNALNNRAGGGDIMFDTDFGGQDNSFM